MRLLLLSTAPIRGGAEDYVVTIALGAKAADWDATVAMPRTEGTLGLVDELQRHNIPVRDLPCVDPWGGGKPATSRQLAQATVETVRMLRVIAPDVVHLTLAWPGFGMSSMLAPAVLGIPTIVVFQLVPETPILRWPPVVYKAIRSRRQRWVTVSEHGREVLSRELRVAPPSIEVIHNGAPLGLTAFDDSHARATARAAVRRELDLPDDSQVILAVGRLHAQKAHADLCVAAAPVLERVPTLHVLVAGEGPERSRLERLTDDLGLAGRVKWLGRRDDVPDLLAAADLFVFPSHFEGSPFSLKEAMAAGVPVIAAAFPGAHEVLRDGREGLLFPVGDRGALRQSLEWALDHRDAMDVMARAARDRAREWSEDRMVRRTLDVLEAWHHGERAL